MKVRWRKGSFRLRISPSDLASMEAGEPVREAIEMPGGAWSVEIVRGASTGIELQGGAVLVRMAPDDVVRLASPENEGVYFRTESPSPLDWFIEKDFPCVHPRPPGVREAPEETFEAPPRFAERHKSC